MHFNVLGNGLCEGTGCSDLLCVGATPVRTGDGCFDLKGSLDCNVWISRDILLDFLGPRQKGACDTPDHTGLLFHVPLWCISPLYKEADPFIVFFSRMQCSSVVDRELRRCVRDPCPAAPVVQVLGHSCTAPQAADVRPNPAPFWPLAMLQHFSCSPLAHWHILSSLSPLQSRSLVLDKVAWCSDCPVV